MMNAINSLIAAIAALHLSSSPPPPCLKNCQLSERGIILVTNFEGYSPFIYKDSAGLPTIGIGHLIVKGEKFKEPMLPDEARALLKKDAAVAERAVNRRVHVKFSQGQADAIISFTFNLGEGTLQKSTMLKRINAKQHEQVPPQIKRFVYAGGKKVRGLITRRFAEASIYQVSTH